MRCTQLEDTGVSCRLWLKRGAGGYAPSFSFRLRMAIFQRFEVRALQWALIGVAHNWKIRAFLAGCGLKGIHVVGVRCFRTMYEETVRGLYRKRTAVRVFCQSCGFLRTCADSSWGFSDGWDRNRRLLALKRPFSDGFEPRTIRTTYRKSADTVFAWPKPCIRK